MLALVGALDDVDLTEAARIDKAQLARSEIDHEMCVLGAWRRLRHEQQATGHAEVDEQRVRTARVEQQVLAVPAHRNELGADELLQLRARRLAVHVQALPAIPY